MPQVREQKKSKQLHQICSNYKSEHVCCISLARNIKREALCHVVLEHQKHRHRTNPQIAKKNSTEFAFSHFLLVWKKLQREKQLKHPFLLSSAPMFKSPPQLLKYFSPHLFSFQLSTLSSITRHEAQRLQLLTGSTSPKAVAVLTALFGL